MLSMRSEAVADLVATTAEVERLRLTLQGSYRGLPVLGGMLTPALEVGGRYDGRRRGDRRRAGGGRQPELRRAGLGADPGGQRPGPAAARDRR